MYPITTLPDRTITIDGDEWLYASGTAYLGMAKDPEFRQILERGFDRYGMHYGGSRLASIRLDIFEEGERHLARLTGAEDAVIVSSGTLAGQLAASLLAEQDRLMMAPETHPALWGATQPMEGSRKQWIRRVLEQAARWDGGLVLFSNALDGMRARAFDFSWLGELPSDVPTVLVVDESHAIGLLGPEGGGHYRALQAQAPHVKLLLTGSLGKAFGIPAGFVAGSSELIAGVRKLPSFGGAAPPSPAWIYALVHGKPVYDARRALLRSRIRAFRAAIGSLPGYRFLTNFPVVYSHHSRLSDYLATEKILISSFAYPSPDDPPLQRIVLNAAHRPDDLDKLAASLRAFSQQTLA